MRGKHMILTPTELERLTIFGAAQLARRNLEAGVKLSAPEAVALICDEIMLAARKGQTVSELVSFGKKCLTEDDVLPGVRALLDKIQVEGMFPDGAKMVVVHDPIAPGQSETAPTPTPGEIIPAQGEIELNRNRKTTTVNVINSGDRPIQVGSHFHFYEANKSLVFNRPLTLGMRLDIPAGTSHRFEPGEMKEIRLVAYGGTQVISGFNNLTNGNINDPIVRERAFERAKERGFGGA